MKIGLSLLLLLLSLGVRAEDSLSISLVTRSPGEALYAGFGHSALLVENHTSGRIAVYNYGMFDFRTPNFYTKFIRGRLDYFLGVQSADSGLKNRLSSGNWIKKQTFDLTEAEKKAIISYLNENLEPKNRYYQYDFFYDNCATRIRDLLDNVLGEKLLYPPSSSDNTLRDMLDIYMKDRPWTDFGIDLLLGMPADDVATIKKQMFLPEYLALHLENSEVIRPSGKKSLINNEKKLSDPLALPEPPLLTPLLTTGLLLGLVLAMTILIKSSNFNIYFDNALLILLGLVGVFLTFMWWGTNHLATQQNMNILWANPLFLAFLFIKDKNIKFALVLFFAVLAIIIGLSLQSFHIATFPLIGLLIARAVKRLFYT